ncbi:MAG: hypothetical protein GF421_13715 [Candidatus Aminicenantes bacterium]|nr:hypothetical protein [Candidatus Aminicenantes bacterium]
MKIKSKPNQINRREFLKKSLAAGSLLALSPSQVLTQVPGQKATRNKVIILGFDGVDPHLLKGWMDQGKLPAFQRLRESGDFRTLKTSCPPQSPVAWSNFITGMNPGGHGIYDFIHRDPETYIPIFSASKTSEAAKTISINGYEFPLSKGDVQLLRKGRAWWQILEDYDIPSTVFKIPSNYPPAPTKQRTLSGMGTPDILGTYGICNFYTTQSTEVDPDIGGARVHEVYVIGNQVHAKLPGPDNPFKKEHPETSVDFVVYLDPVNPVVKIKIQNHEFILREGEWSNWKKIHFNMIPTQSVQGICNFYVKQVRPEFKLYISPINIDPADPVLPLSTPKSYSKELEKEFGPFFTKGLPADTSALTNGFLNDGEFLEQDDIVLEERLKMFDYELNRFDSGVLFYYFSSTDQRQHMFWRHIDASSPLYDEKLASHYKDTIFNIYQTADMVLDQTLKKADKDTIVMAISDHGFTPFRRQFHINTWLKENGYHRLINERNQGEDSLFMNTDWGHTKAYALGLNGLYINQKNRESQGIVSPGAEKDNLVYEIAGKLEKFRDPQTGEKVVLKAFVADKVYSGNQTTYSPDIILGFNRGYRISWASPLGRIPKKILEDNQDKWSGDHCMAPQVIPGIFLANRKIKKANPALYDLSPTILKIFRIPIPGEIVGTPVF